MNIEDKTYENETKLTPKDDRGDLDLTKQIDEKDKRIILLETKLKKMVQRNLALYSHIKNVQDINDAHQKLNGVLQRKLSDAETKLKDSVQLEKLRKGGL